MHLTLRARPMPPTASRSRGACSMSKLTRALETTTRRRMPMLCTCAIAVLITTRHFAQCRKSAQENWKVLNGLLTRF